MNREAILGKIKNDTNLMSLPQVVSKILEITSEDEYSMDDLADAILKDPSLTAKVLQLSNSTFYGRATKIKSINQAISLVGGNTIKCLTLSTSVLNFQRISSETGIESRDFFTYILSVATACEAISKIIHYPSPEEALIAGLLHDIGVIYFLNNFSKEYGQVVELQNKGFPIHDAEAKVFGITHSDLGFNLAHSWNIPDNISRAIANHHDLENLVSDDVLSNMVKLSILITYDRFANSVEDIEKRLLKTAELAQLLNIRPQGVAEITANSISRLIEISEIFGVEINDIEDLVARANREIWKSYLTIENLFKEREELNKKLLEQQKIEAALEARNEALSTLSHYLNNAIMIISGQSQLIGMMRDNNQIDKLLNEIPTRTEEIRKSVEKIGAVMDVLKEISPLSHDDYFNFSRALNIDDRINEKLSKINAEKA